MKKIIAIVLTVIVAACAFAGCSANNSGKNDAKTDGKIDAKIILVLEDQSEVSHDIHVTDGATVREALFEAGLIDENAKSAMFVDTIDGHTANIGEGVTWMLADENGKQITSETGIPMDDTTVSAGQTYKFIYTVVPDFD